MSTRAYKRALAQQEKNKSEIPADNLNEQDDEQSSSDEEPNSVQAMSKFSADILDDYFGGADSDTDNENGASNSNGNQNDNELKR